jgi:hypothetical protein
MASRPIIEKFKADRKVDITNVIYLTDGEGTISFAFGEAKPSPIDPETRKPKIQQTVFLVDQKTKMRIEFKNINDTDKYIYDFQTAMTQFVRTTTRCKHIGFYIGHNFSVRNLAYMNPVSMSEAQIANLEKFWRENDYFTLPSIGYDMYYYVKENRSNVSDEDYTLSTDMTTRKIARVFSDSQSDKRKHRVLVSTFAKDIAA